MGAKGGMAMPNRTYELLEVVGTSPEGVDQAVRNAIARVAKTTRHVDWFEVQQIRGYVRDGEVDHFQVTMKVGYRLEDA
jgi:flavin-binding protein dodecin